ncbi:hypothetical protein ASD67_00135 [Sphingopyxis sp. Root1497]|uniref:hypothetical protein n=1 Tax=Sphingopyxis sp. Root1497 TaxID=1736474 RepID=UPI0006FCABD8|nr:hypothetical protein [Sphingopyxis sp. Root1497]KQZ65564.1 hypothetical protein ASD67_00135 [Sphingopyxis sp. Root1497]
MTQPPPYRPNYAFGDAGTALPPGVPLDAELLEISRTFTAVLRNLSLIQRDDTKLRNGIVTIDTLDPKAVALISAGTFSIAGVWEAGAKLAQGAFVSRDTAVYLAMREHVATTIEAALAAGDLVKVFEPEVGERARDEFVGNGIQTAFGLSQEVATAGDIEVFVNGVLQPAAAYSVVGSTLTFAVAPANAAKVSALSLSWSTTPPLATLVTMVQQGANQLALATGSLIKTTWPELLATEGTALQKAVVLTGGIGTHTDPLTDLEVRNTGFYQCVEPPYGWERVAPLQGDLTGDAVVSAAVDAALIAAQVGADRLAASLAKQVAEGAAVAASDFADDAESAAIAAAAAGKKFTSTALGIAGTSNGDYFVVPATGGLAIWQNVSGVATAWPAAAPAQKIIATSEALATAVAAVVSGAATVGIETGSTQSRGGIGGVEKGGVKLRATTYFDIAVKAQVANEFLSLPQMLMRRTVHMPGHSAVAASGAVAGATVNPRSGLNGGPGRSLEYVLRQISPDWRVIARGTSAQTGPNIAQRTGGLPTLVTLDGGATTLGASGAVGCTCSPDSGPSMRRGQAVESYYGKVNGAPCILKCTGGPNANSPVYTIEQLNGTATIPLTPGTAFFLNADLLDYAIHVFWMTQNDPVVQVSIDAVAAAVGKLPKPSRYVIIGDWPQAISLDGVSGNGSQDIGTDPHNRMLQKNAILREQYGADFLDPYALFRNEYPYNGAMYRSLAQFTGEDDTQSSYNYVTPEAGDWRARGLLPRRWMGVHEGGVDYSHGNSQFYQQISFANRDLQFRPKGWLDL